MLNIDNIIVSKKLGLSDLHCS